MRHRRTRHRPNYLLRFGALAFLVAAYCAPHADAEPATPEVVIWSPAPEQSPIVSPTTEPTVRPVKPPVESAQEPTDCADQEDPDLCVELGDEYSP